MQTKQIQRKRCPNCNSIQVYKQPNRNRYKCKRCKWTGKSPDIFTEDSDYDGTYSINERLANIARYVISHPGCSQRDVRLELAETKYLIERFWCLIKNVESVEYFEWLMKLKKGDNVEIRKLVLSDSVYRAETESHEIVRVYTNGDIALENGMIFDRSGRQICISGFTRGEIVYGRTC
jgi:ribosomal protein S27AE